MPATSKQLEDFLALFDGDVAAAQFALRQYIKRTTSITTPISATTHSNQPIVISVEHASKTYTVGKQIVHALDTVSFTVHKGEFIAITGASGSGKSTLLHILGCLDKPTSGNITIGGHNTAKLSDAKLSQLRRQTIGFIFQSFYLQPFLRLDDNIAVPAMFTNKKTKQIDTKVSLLLKQVGLEAQTRHFPKELSGGQIQRAAIARALVNNPSIILADEPTGNLDSTNSQSIIDVFKSIRNKLGATIIIVTHDMNIARQADRIIELKDGAII